MNCCTPGFPVLLYLPEFGQTHFHWVDDAIQSSLSLSPPSPALHLSQYQGKSWLSMSWLFVLGGQSNGASASVTDPPVNIQDWFPSGLTGLISLLSKGLSRVSSSTTIWKHQVFRYSAFFMAQLSYLFMTTGKIMALIIWTFAGKVMSLLFNMLSQFVIAFLPKSKCLNFTVAVTVCSDSGAQENKICHCFHLFLIYLPWSDGARCHDLSFPNVEF